MASLDHGFKIVAQESATGLARIAGLQNPTLKPVESTVQTTTERLADRAFLARVGRERFVVYMEFVATWNESVPWSILEKLGMLAKRERLPVVSLIFILRPRRYRNQNGTMQLIAQGNPTNQVWFTEIRLWEIEPESWWTKETGLMAVYPLCRHNQSPSEAIAFAAEKIEANQEDLLKRADLLTTLGIFGGLAYPGVDALSIIGRENMKESRAYLDILNEGAIQTGRRNVLAVVKVRFGKEAATSIKNVLKNVASAKRLNNLHDLALRCSTLDELRQAAVN